MFGQQLVLKTKLQPPRLRRWTLSRTRLAARLDEAGDYRLTLLVAPTGYGKSTLLAGWAAHTALPHAWYSLGQSDSDPAGFLLHLTYAFRYTFADFGDPALELLEKEWTPAPPAERAHIAHQVVLLLVNELCERLTTDTFLIFDDFHWLQNYTEVRALLEEFIEAAPPQLHIVVASRHKPHFERLARWTVQQEVLTLGKETLAFTPAETAQLFKERYGYDLSESDAARLVAETEGWAIALQMVWQNLQGETATTLERILQDLPRNLSGLFEYLAQEVLNRQDAPTQRFLLDTSILRRLTGEACDRLLDAPPGDSDERLRRLSETGLFVISLGDGFYRYHHLFGEFLQSRLQTQPERATRLHQVAADFYREREPEQTLHHLLLAQDWQPAAELLANLGQNWLENGQLERFEHFLTAFPADADLPAHGAVLRLLHGDLLRLTSRFTPAIHNYQRAVAEFQRNNDLEGQVKALRGLAQVYLDTVQPAAAEEWLEGALAVARRSGNLQLQGTLMRDLAENKLNRGRPWQAEELHRQANELLETSVLPGGVSDVRILLRSGRLFEAIERLEQDAEDGELHRPGRSHRERLLVLALLYAMTGDGAAARRTAEQGIQLARELHAPFTEGVAWQRLGHALFVTGEYESALDAYRRGQEQGDKLKVRRLRAEGFMGLCLLHGRASGGDLTLARAAGDEGVLVARQAGDEWIEGFIHVALAAAHFRHNEAETAVTEALAGLALLENCGDTFGQLVARAWLALARQDAAGLENVRRECLARGYRFLLERKTFFGPGEIESAAQFAPPSAVEMLPAAARRLTAITLGSFAVYRPDGTEVSSRDWQRDKARQLFQLLLIQREKSLTKDQILEKLWFNSEPSAAESGFKVALNALVRALEPERSNRAQSSYILRSGSGASLSYSLRLDPDLVYFDAAEFERLVTVAGNANVNEDGSELYEAALALYQGDFLPGCLYEDWAAPERERLLSLFLTTAERVAQLQAARGDWDTCLATCRLILSRDNCWEEAYRLMMTAFWRQHNRTAALRVFEKCSAVLADELGITPMPSTLELYNQILQD